MEIKNSHFYSIITIIVALLVTAGSVLTWAISESRKVSVIEGKIVGSDHWVDKWMVEREIRLKERIREVDNRLQNIENRLKKLEHK